MGNQARERCTDFITTSTGFNGRCRFRSYVAVFLPRVFCTVLPRLKLTNGYLLKYRQQKNSSIGDSKISFFVDGAARSRLVPLLVRSNTNSTTFETNTLIPFVSSIHLGGVILTRTHCRFGDVHRIDETGVLAEEYRSAVLLMNFRKFLSAVPGSSS